MNELNILSRFILEQDLEIQNHIKDSRNIHIYRNNYIGSLIKTLKNKYPTISKILGENFSFTAKQYINLTKSISSNIDNYGDTFHDFLKNFEHTKDINFIYELASIDSFIFKKDTSKVISLPKGSLETWNKVNKSDYNSISINENEIESISIHYKKNEYFLIAT